MSQPRSGRVLTPEETAKAAARVEEITHIRLNKPANEHVSEEADRVVEQIGDRVDEHIQKLHLAIAEMRQDFADSRPQKKARVEKPVQTKGRLEPLLKKEKARLAKLENERNSVTMWQDMITSWEGTGLTPQV